MPFYYAFCNQKSLSFLSSIHQCIFFVVKKVMAEKTSLSKRLIRRARTTGIKLCKLETLAIIAEGLGIGIKDLF